MTGEKRRTLKALIDAKVREAVNAERALSGNAYWCIGCGCPINTETLGCQKCVERVAQRKLRARWREQAKRDGRQHGVLATYESGCRCDPCKGAVRRAARRQVAA